MFTCSKKCKMCKGECYVKGNNAETQRKAVKKFGYLPNQCVNSDDGSNRYCAYAK